MSLTVQDIVDAQVHFTKNIDPSKTCETCEHDALSKESVQCNKCYNELLLLPVNPTEWEASKQGEKTMETILAG